MSVTATINLEHPLSPASFKQAVIDSGAQWREYPDMPGVTEGYAESGPSWIFVHNCPSLKAISLDLGGEHSGAKEMCERFVANLKGQIPVVGVDYED